MVKGRLITPDELSAEKISEKTVAMEDTRSVTTKGVQKKVNQKTKVSDVQPVGKKQKIPSRVSKVRTVESNNNEEEGEEGKSVAVVGNDKKKKNFRNFHKGIPREGIRRLSRRAKIKRMSGDAIDDAYEMVYASFLRVGELASVYAMYSKRKTISRDDMQRALSDMSNKVYC